MEHRMKDNLIEGFVRWLVVVIVTLLVISTVVCQYEAARPKANPDVHPVHKSQEDFEDTIGLKIVTAMSKDDRLLFYKKELKLKVHLGSFGYDQYTRFDDTKWEGTYCVLYCKVHNFAYIVSPCKEKK